MEEIKQKINDARYELENLLFDASDGKVISPHRYIEVMITILDAVEKLANAKITMG